MWKLAFSFFLLINCFISGIYSVVCIYQITNYVQIINFILSQHNNTHIPQTIQFQHQKLFSLEYGSHLHQEIWLQLFLCCRCTECKPGTCGIFNSASNLIFPQGVFFEVVSKPFVWIRNNSFTVHAVENTVFFHNFCWTLCANSIIPRRIFLNFGHTNLAVHFTLYKYNIFIRTMKLTKLCNRLLNWNL